MEDFDAKKNTNQKLEIERKRELEETLDEETLNSEREYKLMLQDERSETHSPKNDKEKQKSREKENISLQISSENIPSIPLTEEFSGETLNVLTNLGVSAYNAVDMEQNVISQIDKAIEEQQDRKFQNRIKQVEKEIESLTKQLEQLTESPKTQKNKLQIILDLRKRTLSDLKTRATLFQLSQKRKMLQRSQLAATLDPSSSSSSHPKEKKKEQLLRTGKITPFDFEEEEPSKKRKTPSKSSKKLSFQKSITENQIKNITKEEESVINLTKAKTGKSSPVVAKKRKRLKLSSENWKDDASDEVYVKRLQEWKKTKIEKNEKKQEETQVGEFEEYVEFQGGYKLSKDIYDALYEYQKTGVKWFWELHCQNVGGILGDEMGLGKTIQIIVFLAGLHYSEMWEGPVLIVCPATVLQQWVQEIHAWYPPFRATLFHDSGSFQGSKKKILKDVKNSTDPTIVLTTYEGVRINKDLLSTCGWQYIILDEGHKIRNPDAEITLTCKTFPTPHRIILSGSPIQNNLTELWSIFDFVFPGKLGTLPTFQTEFSIPITLGGYSNASEVQVQTAFQCAVALKDLIHPYLLRRLKKDVLLDLPNKNEHVLFCQLTEIQRKVYENFLDSEEVQSILDGKRNVLYGIDILRKICNHPDLLHRNDIEKEEDYGDIEKSGKLKVLAQLLSLWKEQKHRVLIFVQTVQMLEIIEPFIIESNYTYYRMDGTTNIKQRIPLVDDFNKNDSIFVFLLSTKVGGLGLNLVGADRVVIFDPDWNPSTDIQARERAWRIGQTREVVIYRLMTAGTIEEKIYHRQIFKQFLTNKILQDPRQRRFFTSGHLHDLFSLSGSKDKSETEELVERNLNHVKDNIVLQVDDLMEIEDQSKNKKSNDEEIDSSHDNSTNSNEEEEKKSETFILKKLIDGEDVIQGIISHDSLLQHSYDKSLVKKEANRVAQQAVEALRNSWEECKRNNPLSSPTWTGQSGKRFGSEKANTFGLSSASLLKSSPSTQLQEVKQTQTNQLLQTLHKFFLSHGGKSSSDLIVTHFKNKLNQSETTLFRTMLKQIATLDKKEGMWNLKPEFLD